MKEKEFARYKVREVAAVFDSVEALDAAVEELTGVGFADGDFNIMATDETVREKLGERLEAVEQVADDPKAPRQAFVPRPARRAMEAAVFGLPMYLLGLGGALGVVATGGAAGLALAAAAAGGAIGGGLGAFLASRLEQNEAEALAEAMKAGGIVLWVSVQDDAAATRAMEVLRAAGGKNVHLHEIERSWGPEDIPLSDFNPDPFIEKDPA